MKVTVYSHRHASFSRLSRHPTATLQGKNSARMRDRDHHEGARVRCRIEILRGGKPQLLLFTVQSLLMVVKETIIVIVSGVITSSPTPVSERGGSTNQPFYFVAVECPTTRRMPISMRSLINSHYGISLRRILSELSSIVFLFS
jgi:hypothetical protein